MKIYENEEKISNGELITRVYLSDDIDSSVVTFYQYVFRGSEVITTNCIEMEVKDFAPIMMSITKVEISKKLINF